MNEEIKEIYFSNLEWIKTHDNMGGVMGNVIFKDNISYEEYNKLFKSVYFVLCDKDYITNLQEENEDLKDRLKVMEHFKNSLQEENEKLKELCAKYEEEHNTAFKLWTMKMEEVPTYEEKMIYKSRCEKANEKLNKLDFDNFVYSKTALKDIKKNLQNILNGGDEE